MAGLITGLAFWGAGRLGGAVVLPCWARCNVSMGMLRDMVVTFVCSGNEGWTPGGQEIYLEANVNIWDFGSMAGVGLEVLVVKQSSDQSFVTSTLAPSSVLAHVGFYYFVKASKACFIKRG